MREITQFGAVGCRMARRIGPGEHLVRGGEPMQTLRASAVALPFLLLAAIVVVLGNILR